MLHYIILYYYIISYHIIYIYIYINHAVHLFFSPRKHFFVRPSGFVVPATVLEAAGTGGGPDQTAPGALGKEEHAGALPGCRDWMYPHSWDIIYIHI